MNGVGWSDRNLEISVYAEREQEKGVLEVACEVIKDPRSVWKHKTSLDDSQATRMEKFLIMRGKGNVRLLITVKRENEESLVAALRKTEKRSKTKGSAIPIEIFAAIIIAQEGFNRNQSEVSLSPAAMAKIVAAGTIQERRNKGKENKEIDVDGYLEEVVAKRKLSQIEAGAVDAAQFWNSLSNALWWPRIRMEIAKETFDQKTIAALSKLARIWIDVNDGLAVNVSGSQYWIDARASHYDWMQIMEWEGGKIRRNALKYMTGYKSTIPRSDGLLAIRNLSDKSLIGERDAAIVSTILLEDARKMAICDPAGSFRIELPEFIFLYSLGITSLRVWVTGNEGMWVGVEKDGSPGFSFRWTANKPHFQRWIVPIELIPTLHITLSALWRDLRVGGKRVMVQNGGESVEKQPEDPGVRKAKFFGKIQWGSEEELAKLLKEIYKVKGHLRKLPWGKRATWRAKTQAGKAGVILKPGTTYVRPHLKGKIEKDDFNIPVHARGLGQLVITEMGI